MQPLISIITPSFNSSATIADTLRSVNQQTWPAIEHLIIDGASKDNTLEVARLNGQRITQIVSEPDKGIYDAMNKGITLAKGEIIGILNSDDFYASPDALAWVAAEFADPSVDIVYGDLIYVSQFNLKKPIRIWDSSLYQPGRFSWGWMPAHPTFFVRRRVYAQCGLFDLSYKIAADFEFCLRALEIYRLPSRHIGQILVHMRTGGASGRFVNKLRLNHDNLRALRQHKLPASWARLIIGKLWLRGTQFVRAAAQPIALA